MERKPVVSSQIVSVGYDAEKQVLQIEFKTRGDWPPSVYEYLDVPAQIHTDLMQAESAGKYFGIAIRGKFDFKKLPPEKAEGATA